MTSYDDTHIHTYTETDILTQKHTHLHANIHTNTVQKKLHKLSVKKKSGKSD